MHRECERRLDIIKGNDRMVRKIVHAVSDLGAGNNAFRLASLNADKRRRDAKDIEVMPPPACVFFLDGFFLTIRSCIHST